MYLIDRNLPVALYGSAEEVEYLNFFKEFGNVLNIQCIFDRDLAYKKESIEGIKVREDEKDLFTFDKIIIIGRNWEALSNHLSSIGELPFRDYITDWVLKIFSSRDVVSYSQMKAECEKNGAYDLSIYIKFISYAKKMAVVYGNCQVPYIVRFLSRTREFNKDYLLLSIPPVQTLETEKETGLNQEIMKRTQLFIYQIIQDDNRLSPKLASNEILGQLSEKCKKLPIPNVFWEGYFPQNCPNPYNPFVGSEYNRDGIFPYGDSNLMEGEKNGKSAQEIYREIKSPTFYKAVSVITNAKNSLDELKRREMDCEIKISDFIEKNFRKKRLFYVPNHPTNFVIAELARRILDYLGYSNYQMDTHDIPENDNLEMPIYPSVANYLKLEFDIDQTYFCRKMKSDPVDLEEYVKIYIQYCYGSDSRGTEQV